MVDEQHPVQVIDLVLDTGCQKSLAMQHLLIAINIQIADIDACRALHIGCLVRD